MSSWKGWDENTVRQNRRRGGQSPMESNISSARMSAGASSSTFFRRSPSPPTVVGFTPINAPRSVNLEISRIAPPPTQRHGESATSQVNAQTSQAKSIASEYLGRGDEEVSVPAATQNTRVTRSSVAKKRSVAPKKRAATSNDAAASKRRKTSDMPDSMPVSKPKPTKAKIKTNTAKLAETNHFDENADVQPSQPVPLFSSSTSMEHLLGPSQQTSFNAAKASKYGTTLYHGAQAAGNQPHSSLVSQPWLTSQTGKPSSSGISSVDQSSSSPSKRAQASKALSQAPKKPPATITPIRILSEDFMANDDDELDADMALLDATETKPKKALGMRPTAISRPLNQQQKPTNSASVKKSEISSTPTLGSSRTLDEDFLVGDDADMDDAFNLVAEQEPLHIPQHAKQELSTKKRRSSRAQGANTSKRRKSADSKKSAANPITPTVGQQNSAANVEDDLAENTTVPLDVREVARPQTPPARQWKFNTREVDEHEDYGGALFSEAEKKILDSLKTKPDNGIKPIVRTPFPSAILDRSPLFGASSSAMLRTCFRIGEALKEGTAAIRSNHNTIIELYARVKISNREGRKQHFIFHDLYHDRPPYLEGTCELWNQGKLWELDTRAFLAADKKPEGVMCRAIARLKRKDPVAGKLSGWRLEVLSIWEAGWDDIDFITGIYGKQRDEVAADDD